MYPDTLNSNFGAWAWTVAPRAKIRTPAKDKIMNFFISFPPHSKNITPNLFKLLLSPS
jgi:hypothetical protein